MLVIGKSSPSELPHRGRILSRLPAHSSGRTLGNWNFFVMIVTTAFSEEGSSIVAAASKRESTHR
jgi:hypothetical protein